MNQSLSFALYRLAEPGPAQPSHRDVNLRA